MGENDTDGNGDVIGIALVERVVLGGCFYNNELYIVLFFKTCPFIDIQGIRQKVQGDVQLFGQQGELLLFQGRQDIDPGGVPGGVNFYGLMVNAFKKLDHKKSCKLLASSRKLYFYSVKII